MDWRWIVPPVLFFSLLPIARAGTCWDYDLEKGGKATHGDFSSMKDESIFGGKSEGGGSGNPKGVAYSNLAKQGKPDEGGLQGTGQTIDKNGSAGGGSWKGDGGKAEEYVKPDGKLLEVQLARLKKALAAGYDGLELDNMDQCKKAGDCAQMVDLWKQVCQATKAQKPDGLCVAKNGIEILPQLQGVDRVIAEIEPENRDELDKFAKAAGQGKLFVVFYGSPDQAKEACQKAQSQGFKMIINSAKGQALSAANNKCCDGG